VSDGTGLAEKMLGLPGLVVLDVEEGMGEVIVRVESTRRKAYCPSCRRRAQAQGRIEVHLRDLHCFGRPCRLVIRKRRWRSPTERCLSLASPIGPPLRQQHGTTSGPPPPAGVMIPADAVAVNSAGAPDAAGASW
jgi:transposase